MLRAKYLLVLAVMALALWSVAPQADAHWGCCGYGYGCGGWGCGYTGWGWAGCCHRGWYRYCGCYSGCYGGCYSPCGYGAGCCNGWTGCGYTTVGGCCGDSGTVVPSAPSSGTYSPAPAPTPVKKPVIESSPMMPTEPAPTPAAPGMGPGPSSLPPPPAAMPKTTGTTAENSGVLTVWVPYEAKVTVNGKVTKSTGSRRQFVSYGLEPGYSYKYVVKVQIVQDGQLQEDTKTVVLTAGQITAVAFGFNPGERVAATP